MLNLGIQIPKEWKNMQILHMDIGIFKNRTLARFPTHLTFIHLSIYPTFILRFHTWELHIKPLASYMCTIVPHYQVFSLSKINTRNILWSVVSSFLLVNSTTSHHLTRSNWWINIILILFFIQVQNMFYSYNSVFDKARNISCTSKFLILLYQEKLGLMVSNS